MQIEKISVQNDTYYFWTCVCVCFCVFLCVYICGGWRRVSSYVFKIFLCISVCSCLIFLFVCLFLCLLFCLFVYEFWFFFLLFYIRFVRLLLYSSFYFFHIHNMYFLCVSVLIFRCNLLRAFEWLWNIVYFASV